MITLHEKETKRASLHNGTCCGMNQLCRWYKHRPRDSLEYNIKQWGCIIGKSHSFFLDKWRLLLSTEWSQHNETVVGQLWSFLWLCPLTSLNVSFKMKREEISIYRQTYPDLHTFPKHVCNVQPQDIYMHSPSTAAFRERVFFLSTTYFPSDGRFKVSNFFLSLDEGYSLS